MASPQASAPAALSTVLNQLWPPYGTYPHEKRLAWALKFTRATHPDSARIFTTLLEPEGIQPAIFRTEPDAKITDLSILPNIAGCFGWQLILGKAVENGADLNAVGMGDIYWRRPIYNTAFGAFIESCASFGSPRLLEDFIEYLHQTTGIWTSILSAMGVDLVEYGKAEHRAFHLLSDSHELEFFEEKFGVHLVDLEYSPRPGDWRLTFYTLNKFAYDFWYLVEVHEPALLRQSNWGYIIVVLPFQMDDACITTYLRTACGGGLFSVDSHNVRGAIEKPRHSLGTRTTPVLRPSPQPAARDSAKQVMQS
ncbi:hypothetical protein M8818_001492 [Zalaria obscura]|uniref:Uncharacterized protein n=1 Tax=Zalaria obscura TaxID=2024903 RepID=A0ACC3SKF3_9PEZI